MRTPEELSEIADDSVRKMEELVLMVEFGDVVGIVRTLDGLSALETKGVITAAVATLAKERGLAASRS